jgi:CheY-like chemotaxis protein
MPRARVLVVDDEPAVLSVISLALSGRGYDVHTSVSALRALNLLKETERCFDLLVSDVIMPDLCGPELARELRQACPRGAVVLM